MYFTAAIAAVILSFAVRSLADDTVGPSPTQSPDVGSGVGLEDFAITPAPEVDPARIQLPGGPAPDASGPFTINVVNKAGNGLHVAFFHDAGSPGAINHPTAGPLGSSTRAVLPTGWAGGISIAGRQDVANARTGSLIEGSFKGGKPSYDVSYVVGFTTPIVCSCEGKVVTGCNINLFNDQHNGQCPGGVKPGPLCHNPDDVPVGNPLYNGPANHWFAPCAHAAVVYPADTGKTVKSCTHNEITCCVGASCPKNPGQPGNAKRDFLSIGGHTERSEVEEIEDGE